MKDGLSGQFCRFFVFVFLLCCCYEGHPISSDNDPKKQNLFL